METEARGSVKRPTQYTLKGIKLGLFDEDLDRLFRVVQKRRATIGSVRVVTIKPPTIEAQTPTENSTSEEGVRQPVAGWNAIKPSTFSFNANEVTNWPGTDVIAGIGDITDDSRCQPSLVSYRNRFSGSIGVDGRFYSKADLKWRVLALKDESATSSGCALFYCINIGRRNLEGYALEVSPLATTRPRNAVARKTSTLLLSPENFADFYTREDCVKTFYQYGRTFI